MKNWVLIKDSIVMGIQSTENDELPIYTENDIDTVIEDSSYTFNIGDTYSLEKFVNANMTEEEKILQNIFKIKQKANEIILDKYPLYKQINNIRLNTDIEIMGNFIDKIRMISNIAEQNNTPLIDIIWE